MNSTVCPFCSCGCRVYPRYSPDGSLIGLVPLKNHPISRGSLCIRGWKSYEYITHPDRLSTPLVMQNGRQVECSWEEALEQAAQGLKNVALKWGPESIGFIGSTRCSNEDNYIFATLARQVIQTRNIDTSDRLTLFPIFDALQDSSTMTRLTIDIEELTGAKFILVIGTDLFASCPKAASRLVEALDRDAKLAVIDPRTTKLTKLAHYHLRSYPGSDVLWINAMIRHLIREGKVDADFVNTNTTGYNQLKRELADVPFSRIESEFGVSSHLIKTVSELFAEADNAVIVIGSDITCASDIYNTTLASINLALITGHAGKEDTGIVVAGGNNNSMGAWDMGVVPDRLAGGFSITPAEDYVISRRRLEDHPRVGRDYSEILSATASGQIRALYVMGQQFLQSTNEHDRISLSELTTTYLVVQDIFSSALTNSADVVLPAMTHFERGGTFTNLEGRVQRFDAIHPPVGDTKADWDILTAIARIMGSDFEFNDVFEITDKIASVVPFYGYMTAANLNTHADGILCRECTDTVEGRLYHQDSRPASPPPTLFPRRTQIDTNEEFPLVLCSDSFPSFWGTGARSTRIRHLDREQNTCELRLHPKDAERSQVKKGWTVRIVSPVETVSAVLTLDDDLIEGLAHLRLHKTSDNNQRFFNTSRRIRVEPI